MADKRPVKTLRLSFVKADKSTGTAQVQVFGTPTEVRLSTSPKVFISVREDGISMSPGLGGSVSIQGLPQNLQYGGMLADLAFPQSIIPNTTFTAFPKQVFNPPLAKLMPFLADVSSILSTLVM